MLVVLVQEQGHHGGVLQACSTSCQSTTATQHGQPEGCPTLPGCSTVAQPGEHQPGHEEPLAHVSPPRQGQVGFSLPCSGGQHWGALRGDGNNQHEFVTVRFCQTSCTSLSI